MSASQVTATAYDSNELEAVYVLLSEAQYSLANGADDDCADCIESVLERLGLVEGRA